MDQGLIAKFNFPVQSKRFRVMDITKTKMYYEQLTKDDLCDCTYCRNYIHEIKRTYPKLSEYLFTLGIDIEKPFETMLPLGPNENGDIKYPIVQYLVCGTSDDFADKVIDEVTIDISELHPSSSLTEEHFIIDVYPIKLKWIM